MTTTHTPGPWAVAQSAYGPVIDSPEGVPVAKLHYANTGPHQCDASYDTWPYMANARLISASPEMLACLEAIRTAYDNAARHGQSIPSELVRTIGESAAITARAKGWTA